MVAPVCDTIGSESDTGTSGCSSSGEIDYSSTSQPMDACVEDGENGQLDASCRSGPARTLGMWGVAFIVYFNVSGGPFGSEEVVSTCGPLPGFVGMLVLLFLWGMPLALVTAELSSAMPDNGGYTIWVAEAFGEFWGFQESYWSWTSGVVDNALYPVLAYQTAVRLYGGKHGEPMDEDDHGGSGWTAYLCKLALVAIFTLPNLFSARSYGLSLGIAAVLVLLPFLVFSIISLGHAGVGSWWRLLQVKDEVTWQDYGALFSALYWNWSGFDCVSTCAGEVINPGKTFIRAFMTASAIIIITYILPLTTAVMYDEPSWVLWEAGWWSTIALKQVGHWMATWVVLAAFVSNFGQYSAELFEDSWQLAGMADVGMLPKILARRHPVFGTPWYAIAFQVAMIVFLVSFDFMSIVIVDNCFSVLGALLELAAFVKLRKSRPEMPRPFAIPVRSKLGLFLFMLGPSVVGTAVFASTFTGGGWKLPAINVAGLACGPLFYLAMKQLSGAQYNRDETH